MSMSPWYWGAQNSWCGLTSAELRRRVTFPCPALNTPKAAQHSVGCLCSKDTLLALVQPGIHQNSQVLFYQAAFQPGGPSTYWCMGLFLPTLHLPFLNFLSAHETWTSWISYQPMKTMPTSCLYFGWSRRSSAETKLGLSVAQKHDMIYFELNSKSYQKGPKQLVLPSRAHRDRSVTHMPLL